MPTTIVALVIIVFAILPGIPAYKIYKTINGFDWRLPDWEKIVSVIGFSLFGLILYIVFTSFLNLPKPIYLIPETFSSGIFGLNSLIPIALALTGHIFSSIIVSIICVLCVRSFSKISRISGLPSAWDCFVANYVPNHWVVVRLTNSETYAGILEYADTSVTSSERDIILREPASYSEDEKNYRVISFQQLFIPANLVSSIATITNVPEEIRLSKIGSNLFAKEDINERRTENPTNTANESTNPKRS